MNKDIKQLAEKYANLSHEEFDGNIDLHYQNGFIAGYTAGAREATNPEVEQCKKIVAYIDDLPDEDYDPGQALMDIRAIASKGVATTTPLSSSSGDAPFNSNNSNQ